MLFSAPPEQHETLLTNLRPLKPFMVAPPEGHQATVIAWLQHLIATRSPAWPTAFDVLGFLCPIADR